MIGECKAWQKKPINKTLDFSGFGTPPHGKGNDQMVATIKFGSKGPASRAQDSFVLRSRDVRWA